jgi:hypothetical protein
LETGIPARLSPKEGRKFGVLVGGVFLLIGGISRWRGHDTAPYVFWAIGAPLVLGGLLIPGYLGPVYRAWMGFALLLSKITTPIFMGIVYFLVFTPIGAVRRMFGHNTLVRPRGNSFWVDRPEGKRRGDLNRQF